MTREKMIEMLFGAINVSADASLIMDEVRKHDGKITGTIMETIPEYKVASVIFALEEEINSAEARKSGSSNKLSVMKKILKDAKKSCVNKPVFHNCTIVDDYQVAIDGFRGLLLKNHLSGVTNNVPNNEVTEENINSIVSLVQGFLGKINEYCDTVIKACDYKLIENEVRTIKSGLSKYEKDNIRVIIDNKYVYNAEYLIDGLKALNTDEIHVASPKVMAAIKSNDDMYVLMPIGYKKISDFSTSKNIFIQDGKIIKA